MSRPTLLCLWVLFLGGPAWAEASGTRSQPVVSATPEGVELHGSLSDIIMGVTEAYLRRMTDARTRFVEESKGSKDTSEAYAAYLGRVEVCQKLRKVPEETQ